MISKGPIKVFSRRGGEARVYCFTERTGTISKFIGMWWYHPRTTPDNPNPEKLMAKTRKELINKIYAKEFDNQPATG